MAYSCVKVLFEIGHEASIRNKRTPEGFTHDWEVFVRGADNSDIFHFVEKVVFHLHETFPKPKRVVKDPPYSVKESGYAGFTLPIDIYFKNSDEPKKVRFNYDLNLQQTGPPISKVLREQYVFLNPAEDLRRRLIKGGGVGVLGSESSAHLPSSDKLTTSVDETHTHKHSSTLVGKPKLSSSDPNKKHKVKEGKGDESRVTNPHIEALFGETIKIAKVSPDPKKSSHSSPKVSPVSKSNKPVDKTTNAKSEKSSKSSKHGPQKEGKESSDRSSGGSKEEKKDKEKHREKDKNKDKTSKRPSTPVKPPSTPPKRPSSPPKRPSSPSPVKRPSSPSKLLAPPTPAKLPSSPKHSSASKPVKEDPKKPCVDENKTKSESKVSENNKSEKKKKDKKNRDEKPKKDKHKDHEKGSEKASKSEKNKDSKEKDSSKKSEKEVVKEPEKTRDKEKDKSKHGEGDKEKQRHKHKKKDKSNKDREKERERDKSSKKNVENKISNEIRDKDKNGLTNEPTRGTSDSACDLAATHKKPAASSTSPSPIHSSASPLKPSSTPEKLVSNTPTKEKHKRPLMLSDDSSNSNSLASSAEEDIEPPVSRIKTVKTSESGLARTENKTSVLPVTEPPRPNSRSELIKPKSDNSSQERNSLNKSSSKQKDKSSKKNKERESVSGDGEKNGKKSKRKRSSKGLEEGECVQNNIEGPLKVPKLEVESESLPLEPELEEKPCVEKMETKEESEPEEPPPPPPPPPPATHLTEEYVSQLRELQHKIMTLEDNAELQRVVQVIAETGQYEITKKTFDFDLCALDRSTVKRLQEFFAPS